MPDVPALLPIALLLTAAAPAPVPPPAPLRLIETLSPQGVQQVSPGAIVSAASIGRPDSVILAGDLALDWKGEQRRFARGDVLRASGATGVAGVPEAVFCESEQKASLGTALTGQLAFGLVGALRPTKLTTRYCLFDRDADGRFDHAVLIGAKGKGRSPFGIAPLEYGMIEGQRLASDALLSLRYAGPAGSADSIAFDLEAFGFGTLREVPEPRHFIPISKLPQKAVIGAGVLTVLAYNPETRVATVRMDHDLAPGHIVVPELSRGY